MPVEPKNVAIFGATGSIGQSTLDVIDQSGGAFRVWALSAHRSFAQLITCAQRHLPRFVIASDAEAAGRFDWSQLPSQTTLLTGPDALRETAAQAEVDIVVSAIVGRAGLESTLAALESGKRVALANKETLVVAGHLARRLAAEHGGEIIPVDSEHSAIFQAIEAGRREEVARVILTASGGPFRSLPADQLQQVTVEQALDHPTWKMGPKITIDSATMMNKALEIIEARWLFDLGADQIDVVVHPQSVVHSMVEFVDGSVLAQLSPPDMRLPIQLALTHPRRVPCPAPGLDLTKAFSLDFEPPDFDRFPALELGKEVAHRGGTCGAVLNAANEVAVARFLEGKIPFVDIYRACRDVINHHHYDATPTLSRLLELDAWAREESEKWIFGSSRRVMDQAPFNS